MIDIVMPNNVQSGSEFRIKLSYRGSNTAQIVQNAPTADYSGWGFFVAHVRISSFF